MEFIQAAMKTQSHQTWLNSFAQSTQAQKKSMHANDLQFHSLS